jgi:CDP-diacylglycerol--serine O-phosphatidyltransferase
MFFMLSNSQHEISTHFMLPYLGFYHDGFLLPFGCIQHRYPSDEFIHWFTDSSQCAVYFKFTPSVKIFDSLIVLEILTNQWVLLIITLFSAYILNAEIPLFSLKIKSLILRITHYKLAFCFFFLLFFFQYAGIH